MPEPKGYKSEERRDREQQMRALEGEVIDDRANEIAARDARALRLRLAGAQYDEIARQLGWAGPSGAFAAVGRELKRRLDEPAEELRQIELMRLDRVQLTLWSIITASTDPENADAVEIADVLRAVLRFLQLSKRRSELLGLDAPKKIDITHQLRMMAIEEGLDPDLVLREAEKVLNSLQD